MNKIENSVQFNALVKEFRGKCSGVLSNCFLMGAEIDALAAEEKLFAAEFPGWLLIICDREGYSNLYYYADKNADTAYVSQFMKNIGDREVYLDVVTRNGRGDNETPDRLINGGAAEKYKSYQRMQLAVKDIDFDALEINISDGYTLSDSYCNCEEIHRLWSVALDEKSTPLPTESELKELCDDGCLLSVLDSEGKLAGVIMLGVSSKQVTLQHLAVSPDHRRKGIALCLCHSFFLASKEKELTLIRLWVDRANLSAIALYDRLGFTVDGMICDQLYMKGN